jgi:acetylornithine/N-succinyldiaminopimelate aminotransferase
MDTKIGNVNLAKRWKRAMQTTYSTPRLNIDKGQGVYLFDSDGRKYLDFLGGIATNALGHNHPKIVKAIGSQIRKLSHVSNIYGHETGLSLAEALIKMTGEETSRVYFCNSGTEAVEAAIKLSRLTGKKRIISAHGSFHGRTMGSLTLTAQPKKQSPFKPLLRNVKYIKYGDLKSLERKLNRRTAMVILEPIMGEAGVIVPPDGFLKGARELCTKYGALLAFDCVQTGMGRTGSWFGYEHEEVTPDIITIAKGIGGGLPLGAMITIGEKNNLFQPGSHGSTFGGNPISCAAANAVISEIKEKQYLVSNLKKGKFLIENIENISGVKEVRGRGLLIGIELTDPKAELVATELEKAGFLVNSVNSKTIRLAPSYLITDSEIRKFAKSLARILGGLGNG